jgi:separase
MATVPTTRRNDSFRQITVTKTKKTAVSTEQLADQLAISLTVSKQKGKQKASAVLSDEDPRILAMRSVNSASQSLSVAVQSGWKLSSGTTQSKSSSTLSNVTASAALAAKHLTILRSMCPNDVDVERAAVSVLAKLVALEMVGYRL